jgi:hypothetical protein
MVEGWKYDEFGLWRIRCVTFVGEDVASSAVWFSWGVRSPCLLPSSIQVQRPYMHTRPTAASTSKQLLTAESRTRTLFLLPFAAFCSAEVA